jgi:hypothetical protein
MCIGNDVPNWLYAVQILAGISVIILLNVFFHLKKAQWYKKNKIGIIMLSVFLAILWYSFMNFQRATLCA